MEQQKTILHLINSLGRGGAETLLKNTILLLPEYKHIICYLNDPDDFKEELSEHTVICLRHRSRLQTFSSINRIRKIIRQYRVDIVHSHLLESTWLGRLANNRRVSFVTTIHSVLSKDAFEVNPNSLYFEKITVSARHNIIAVSQTVLNDYLKHVAFKGQTFVLHNFVNPVFFENPKKEYSPKSNLCLVAIGNLKAAKNYDYVLDAFKMLKDIPVTLDIYGSGQESKTLQSIIDSEKLNIKLMGTTTHPDKILAGYDAYIISSKHEGFGIAPLEAMAKGLPVFASDIPVFREVMGDNALYFGLENARNLSDIIKNVFTNQSQLETLGKKGREQAQKIASASLYIQNLKAIYQQISDH